MPTFNSSGAPAGLPSTITAGQLLPSIRAALADNGSAVWTDSELLGYLNEAVREYSGHLPRLGETTIAAVAGERRYALPAGLALIISIEHPAGATPPSFIYRLSHTNRRFGQGRVYDVLPREDGTAPPVLWLGFDPEPGTVFRVRYSQAHDAALTADSAVTVPVAHHHVLVQYVLFAAARRLQQQEQANPTSSSSLLMSQLASNTRRLELAYLNALNRLLNQRQGEGQVVAWGGRSGGR